MQSLWGTLLGSGRICWTSARMQICVTGLSKHLSLLQEHLIREWLKATARKTNDSYGRHGCYVVVGSIGEKDDENETKTKTKQNKKGWMRAVSISQSDNHVRPPSQHNIS